MSRKSRRFARDQKYSVGYDHASGADTSVIGHWEDGVFHVDQTHTAKIDEDAFVGLREILRTASIAHIHKWAEDVFDNKVIEGEYTVVETDERRLLDAGESEP